MSTLVAIGILGIVIAITTNAFKQGLDAHKSIVLEGEHEDLRRYVRMMMSCDKTFPSNGCPPGNLHLKRKNGANLAASHGGYYLVGEYKFKATCTSHRGGERTIDIEAMHTAGKKPVKLFKAVPLTCPAKR